MPAPNLFILLLSHVSIDAACHLLLFTTHALMLMQQMHVTSLASFAVVTHVYIA